MVVINTLQEDSSFYLLYFLDIVLVFIASQEPPPYS